MTSKNTSNGFRLKYLLSAVLILFDPSTVLQALYHLTNLCKVLPAVFFITAITALHKAVTDASWGQALSQWTSMAMATDVPTFWMLVCSHTIISHAGMYPAHVVCNFSIHTRSVCSCTAVTVARYSHERPASIIFLKLKQFMFINKTVNSKFQKYCIG